MRRLTFIIGVLFLIVTGVSLAQETPANPLEGKRFVSLEKLTGGDRPDGKINKIHWTIRFEAKSFQWLRTDVVSRGTYEYDAKTGAVKTDAAKAGGSYDSKTGILTWGGHKYKADTDAK